MLIAWVLSAIATFFLGFYIRTLKDTLDATKEVLKTKVEKKPTEEPKSIFIDPLDELQTAEYEMKKRMEELNG